MKSPKNSGRGGAREGAGRLPTIEKRTAVAIYLPPDLIEIIKPRKDKSRLVEELLRKYLSEDRPI